MNSEASHSWQKANITLFSVGSGLDGLKCLAETPTRRFLSPQTEKNKAPHFFFFFLKQPSVFSGAQNVLNYDYSVFYQIFKIPT